MYTPPNSGGAGTLACGRGGGGVPIPTRDRLCGTLVIYARTVLCGPTAVLSLLENLSYETGFSTPLPSGVSVEPFSFRFY
jgi:hypothetical protein